jgi:hypothetical protein
MTLLRAGLIHIQAEQTLANGHKWAALAHLTARSLLTPSD